MPKEFLVYAGIVVAQQTNPARPDLVGAKNALMMGSMVSFSFQ